MARAGTTGAATRAACATTTRTAAGTSDNLLDFSDIFDLEGFDFKLAQFLIRKKIGSCLFHRTFLSQTLRSFA